MMLPRGCSGLGVADGRWLLVAGCWLLVTGLCSQSDYSWGRVIFQGVASVYD